MKRDINDSNIKTLPKAQRTQPKGAFTKVKVTTAFKFTKIQNSESESLPNFSFKNLIDKGRQ